jgi:putative cardiolipin synthase
VISRRADSADLGEVIEFLESNYREARDKISYFPLDPVDWDEYLRQLQNSFAAGTGVLVQDSPAIDLERPTQLVEPLMEFVARAEHRVLLSSPYLIPDPAFFDLLADLEQRGVEVIIVTNSLASNNHMIAHAGYKRWRKRLLRIGVDLYEARDDSDTIDFYTTPPTEPAFLGLHTKAAVVDDRWSYIGSANIDPRSLIINTELAYFIDSTELASRLTELIDRDRQPSAAWQVTLDERGRLRWTSGVGTVKRQPSLGLKQRITQFFIALLPIKNQA